MGDSSYPGERLLRGENSREILARLVDGDPLELGGRCREQLHASAYLLSVQRLHLRAVARIARAAVQWRGDPPLDVWLGERIQFSMKELLEEDGEAVISGLPDPSTADERYSFLSALLGIELFLAPRACVAFNAEPLTVRRAFFAIVVERGRLNRYVAEGNGSPQEVQANLKRAFRALGLQDDFRRPARDEDGYDEL